MQQGSSASHLASVTATMTDEQILDMEPDGVAQVSQGNSTSDADSPDEAGTFSPAGDSGTAATAKGEAGVAHENSSASSAGKVPGDIAEGDPAWLAGLAAQPEAAAEARRWRDAAKDVAALDAAYFSAEPGARSGLAARLFQSDPAAFREMLAESARMLATRDPQGLAELARQLGMPLSTEPETAARSVRQAVHPGEQAEPAAQKAVAGNGAFPAEAYRSFESATNEDVGRRMHEAINRTLSATLPEGVAEGARRRIGEDVFREVHASLANDRELARRVGETLRDWRFDAAARQQVAALVSGRAKAVLPEVARRVVAEWTSSVLASDRAKTARIDAAASRHDITGGRLPEPVPASALRPRDIDYRRLSDEQILEM